MKVTIDDREIEAADGETVLQLARRVSIEIPHFCYHQKLSVAGSCRLCLVKVNHLPKLMPACNVALTPGMVIDTQADEVRRARRQVMQFVMLNHPVDCGICDKAGECRLQDYQREYGAPQALSVDPKIRRRKLHALSERISLDNERCILCSRCVRFTREVSGSGALGIVDRGSHSTVDRVSSAPFNDPYSDNVIGLCPTGALLSRDFMYQSRVWFLEPVDSVCNGCARGCNVQVWRRRRERAPQAPGLGKPGHAYRISARDTPEVNGPWLCNRGFDLHTSMAQPRLLAPQVSGASVDAATALAAARDLLRQAARPAALVSSQASNEELDAFAALAAHVGPRMTIYVRQDRQPEPGEVVEDALLIRADKNPNGTGARARFGAAAFDPAAGHDALLVWGDGDAPAGLDGVRTIRLASFAATAHAMPQPDVLLPIPTHFERDGSFTNFQGRVSRFAQVFARPAGVLDAAEVFAALAAEDAR